MNENLLILMACLPFLGALTPGLAIRAGRNVCTGFALAPTLVALAALAVMVPVVWQGGVIEARLDWLPALGLSLGLRLDALSMMFAGMILGMGVIVTIYARHYLSGEDPMGRFYTFLLLFQGAMLGIVLSANLLVMVIFWEITSLASFLLIGFWSHLKEARQGARMALAVTGLGGLALAAGVLVLGQIAGSLELAVVLEKGDEIRAHALYLPALLLILLGAFTKSAQFPFHFWLPHAMAAPTPVSTYLHSATMVKAGVFLLARLWPVLAGTDAWFAIVATTGLVTMLVGAAIALFKDDLKALLAYSTVSHLGSLTLLLGIGTRAAAIVAVLHVLTHLTFKATLFMVAGIVDHSTGTRDIRRLGGLAGLMPITATIATVAGLSMAGIPPLNGYLTKEMMLEETTHALWLGSHWAMPAVATLAALFSVAYSLRFVGHVFFGAPRDSYPHEPHEAGPGLWGGPAILALACILLGLMPQLLAAPLVGRVAAEVVGAPIEPLKLKLWHGVTPALLMSGVAVLGGIVVLASYARVAAAWRRLPSIEAKAIFTALVACAGRISARISAGLHDGSLSRYVAIFVAATVAIGAAAFLGAGHVPGARPMLPVPLPIAVIWTISLICVGAIVLFHRERFIALILVAVVGLSVSVAFVYLSAPDLALTQVSVETVTTLLMLLALNFLPKQTPVESSAGRRLRDGVVAVAAGAAVAALSLVFMTRDFQSISAYHLANSKTGGGGTNVVNVILVDFRGFDTFGEIIVLGIAGLTIYALLTAMLDGRAGRRLRQWRPLERRSGDRHPMMMVVIARLMMPLSLMVGVFIFLRGHNQPGGGFIAGLIIAVAYLVQYMASGFQWTQARQRIEYHGLIGAGVFVAGLTGMAAWFFGRPFLTSAFGYVKPPLIEKFELASAMAFDLGVFLTVLGAVMLALYSLSTMARTAGETVNVEPMDVDPTQEPDEGEVA